MNKGDIVEYCGRKYYICEIDYSRNLAYIAYIDIQYDGYKYWYSFDDPDFAIRIDLSKIKKSHVYVGDSSFIDNIFIGG